MLYRLLEIFLAAQTLELFEEVHGFVKIHIREIVLAQLDGYSFVNICVVVHIISKQAPERKRQNDDIVTCQRDVFPELSL